MITRLLNLYERLRSSLWVVPALLTVGAFILSQLTMLADAWIQQAGIQVPLLFPGGLQGARHVLGALVASMVSLTTISFSMMMVVLTLASSQFGPRVLRNFLSDRVNQVALGVFVATFVYCLGVLSRVPESDGSSMDTPRLAVTLAVALTLLSLGTLISFIHHIARSIQASQVVMRAHGELQRSIRTVYPDLDDETKPADPPAAAPERPAGPAREVRAERPGYLQAIATDEVLKFARTHDAWVQLHLKPGQFVNSGDRVAEVWARSEPPPTEALAKSARDWLVLGPERTGEQDVQFGFRQITEIATRALSPGINDPATAVSCIDYIGEALADLAARRQPPTVSCDEDGRPRCQRPQDQFTDIAAVVFDNLRVYGRGHPEVMRRLVAVLAHLAPRLQEPGENQWALTALESLATEAKHLGATTDRERYEAKCADTREVLEAAAG